MHWHIRKRNPEHSLIDHLLHVRDITDTQNFLNPSLDHIHSPTLLYGAYDAAEKINQAIEENKKIFIHGDFDVDGVTATSIMWDFLHRRAGADVLPYIPDRFSEGYGLSPGSVQSIIDQGGDMIISVDCGVKDVDVIHGYADRIDFIITDHHSLLSAESAEATYSYTKTVDNFCISADARAVVHPQLDTAYPFHEICGAAVSWKVCQAIADVMDIDFDMYSYLDLVAFGTVCDVMPLVDENRAIVAEGIHRLQREPRVGFRALADIARVLIDTVSTYHFGYVFGPRINAAGRLAHAMDGVRLFTTESPKAAHALATKLDVLNRERQQLTRTYTEEAREQITTQQDNLAHVVIGEKWPEGILGLIAGSLSREYNRPVIVLSEDEDQLKGSARSIDTFNIAKALVKLDKHLLRHGGHAQAAGLQVAPDAKDTFINAFYEQVSAEITQDMLSPTLLVDSTVTLPELSLSLYEELQKLQPFGTGNEEPRFVLESVILENKMIMGRDNQHVKLFIRDADFSLVAIGFGKAQDAASFTPGDRVSLVGSLMINTWQGNTELQLRIEDIRSGDE